MDSIQEAFLMLNVSPDSPEFRNLPTFQRYALILHAINLKKGFLFMGF